MSNLNLFINLKVAALEKSINDNIPAELFNNENVTAREDVKVQALKSGTVQLKVEEGNALYYLVPIKIVASKDIGLTVARATGEIVLVFKTVITINKDWTISPSTVITDYKWTEKPILKVGFLILPIESMVTKQIYKRKEMIYRAIDEQISAALDLQPFVAMAQAQLQAPIKIAEVPQVWLKINPQRLQMTPLGQDKGRINMIVGTQAEVSAFVGNKMENGDMMARLIPDLEMVETLSKKSTIQVPIGLTYEEVTKLIATQVKGQTFNWKQWAVKVESVQLSGKANKLLAHVAISGNMKGIITVESTPVFHVAEQIIEMTNIDLSFESSNFLQRNLFNMAEGFIKKQIAQHTRIDIKPHLKNLVKPLAYQKLMSGVILMSQFSQVSLQSLQLAPEGIMAEALAKGKIVIMVEELLMPAPKI